MRAFLLVSSVDPIRALSVIRLGFPDLTFFASHWKMNQWGSVVLFSVVSETCQRIRRTRLEAISGIQQSKEGYREVKLSNVRAKCSRLCSTHERNKNNSLVLRAATWGQHCLLTGCLHSRAGHYSATSRCCVVQVAYIFSFVCSRVVTGMSTVPKKR